ncbi:MAG: glycosyltransferase [Thermomicrobiales bacterium]
MPATAPEFLERPTVQPIAVKPAIPHQQPVLRGVDIAIYSVLALLWVIGNLAFWVWWFQPEHVVTWPRMILATLAMAYDFTFMPLAFFFFLVRMRQPEPIIPPAGLRVAMATAIVPSSESLDVLERTLAAMVAVRYPHDNWVLDEGGDDRVRELCDRYGAHYWSRRGIPEFNQPDWPFQAKTKSGNYNAWFNDVAYDAYDFLVQLDTDHAPVPEYLDEVLGYFGDPDVAYVALPSVYWNLTDWTARGSSEQSQVFQGPMQMGYYGWARTPMIIGSHAAYRIDHLKEIGGFAAVSRRRPSGHAEARASWTPRRLRLEEPCNRPRPAQPLRLPRPGTPVGIFHRSGALEVWMGEGRPGIPATGRVLVLRALVHMVRVDLPCALSPAGHRLAD